MIESYTPGHSQNAADFMARRTLESHGQFFLPYLSKADSVLDCGCGPGSITLGIAEQCAPGEVVGIDFGESQIRRAIASAETAGIQNVRFEAANCYSLPFRDRAFDRAFSHALLEHLTEPQRALAEIHRVLKPQGVIGVCSPDWDGFILAPPSPELSRAIAAYTNLQTKNGGDVRVGRRLGTLLAETGFSSIRMSARYECYPSSEFIGEYLALQLDNAGDTDSAQVLRNWSRQPGSLFAQAWVASVAIKQT